MPRKHLCLAGPLWLTEVPTDCLVFPVPCWFLGSWMHMGTVLVSSSSRSVRCPLLSVMCGSPRFRVT